MIIYDSLSRRVVSTSSLLPYDRNQFSYLMKLPGREFMTTKFLLGDLSLGKSLSTFAAFQVPIAKNNQYHKVAYFRVACPKSYSHDMGWHILILFNKNVLHFVWSGGYMAYIILKIGQTIHLKFLYFFWSDCTLKICIFHCTWNLSLQNFVIYDT